MRTMGVIIFLLLLLAAPLYAEDAPQTGDLTIIVSGFKTNNGYARIALSNSEQTFQDEDKAFCLVKARITNYKVTVILKDIPFGTYAVSVFHDENGSGKLERNVLGIPKEDYGFSNNARGKVNPPGFDKVRFELNTRSVIQYITVK